MNLTAEVLTAASDDRDEKIMAVANKVDALFKKELPAPGDVDLALAVLVTEFNHVLNCYGPEDRAYVLEHYVNALRQRVISQRNKGMN